MGHFAGVLKRLRADKGMTQQELAAAANLSYGALRHLEQGTREPTWESVVKFCKVLGVSPEVFLPAEGEVAEHTPAPVGRPRKQPDAEPAAGPK